MVHDKMILSAILQELDRNDLEAHLTPTEMSQLSILLSEKVDACKYKVDELKARAGLQLTYSKEHKEASEILNREAERLEKRVVWSMQTWGFERLQGTKYSLSLDKSYSTEVDYKPDKTVKEIFPEYVRETTTTEYSWDKLAIKKDIQAGKCPLVGASVITTNKPVFKIHKGDHDEVLRVNEESTGSTAEVSGRGGSDS